MTALYIHWHKGGTRFDTQLGTECRKRSCTMIYQSLRATAKMRLLNTSQQPPSPAKSSFTITHQYTVLQKLQKYHTNKKIINVFKTS